MGLEQGGRAVNGHGLPEPRGSTSEWVLDRLREPAAPFDDSPPVDAANPLSDDDFQLALYVLYELHYRGFEGVDAMWEWEPSLLRVRQTLEGVFESALREAVGPDEPTPEDVPNRLSELIGEADGPPPSRYLERVATL